jgi:hypothetical protein
MELVRHNASEFGAAESTSVHRSKAAAAAMLYHKEFIVRNGTNLFSPSDKRLSYQ